MEVAHVTKHIFFRVKGPNRKKNLHKFSSTDRVEIEKLIKLQDFV